VNNRIAPLLIIFLVSLSNSALLTRELAFVINQGIDISTNSATKLSDSISCYCGCSSTCRCANLNGGYDLFFLSIGCWDALGDGGQVLALQSKDTIYKLKNLQSLDLTTPFNITDTSHFSPAFPIMGMDSIIIGQAICPSSWGTSSTTWYLGKTKENNFYLFRYLSQIQVKDSTNQYSVLITRITTIVQTDGTLDFNGAITSVIHSSQASLKGKLNRQSSLTKHLWIPSNTGKEDVYDIQGKHLSISSDRKSFNFYPLKIYITRIKNKM
jgi:hypothetical protein